MLKKSEAITKFETVMSQMLTDTMKRATVQTLYDVKQPLFNMNFAPMLDQLSGYRQKI